MRSVRKSKALRWIALLALVCPSVVNATRRLCFEELAAKYDLQDRSYRDRYDPDSITDKWVPNEELRDREQIHRKVALERPSAKEKQEQIDEITTRLEEEERNNGLDSTRLELGAALLLNQWFPDEWAYFNRRYVDPNPRNSRRVDGKLVRNRFESDVELNCCLVEVTALSDLAKLRERKESQLKRFLNREAKFDFINPDEKDVILYVPGIQGVPSWIPHGVKVAHNPEELKAAVGRSIESRKRRGR